MGNKATYKTIALATIIAVMGLLLGLFTTSQYVRARGLSYLEGAQIKRHRAVLEGHAGNPWQYRVLAPHLVDEVIELFYRLNIPHHIAASFIFFRVIQDTSILLLAFAYYRQLRLSLPHALVGMILLAWGMSHSHYNSDLQFSTFFDVIFYLLAGLCVLQERLIWIVPITVLAALNRETSGLIPFLPLAATMFSIRKGSFRKGSVWNLISICVLASISYVAIFVGLRLIYGKQELIVPSGHHLGLDLVWYNFSRAATWERLMAALSVIPIMALIGYQKWPLQLKGFFWVIVPIWFVVHASGSVMAESRLFLVPQAMVLIPGALFLAQ
jgi:hypothetical protein